jgi:hypothetical protein
MRSVLALLLVIGLLHLEGRAWAQEAPPPTNEAGEEIIPNPSKKWAIGFGGAALGLWLLAAATGGGALALSNSQQGNPANPPVYTAGLADDAKTGASLATTAYICMGLAAALTVVDAVLWYETLRKPRTLKKASIELTPAGVRF